MGSLNRTTEAKAQPSNSDTLRFSSRYVSRLLMLGETKLFTLMKVQARCTIVDHRNIGVHWTATVASDLDPLSRTGTGSTPLAAVRCALERWGCSITDTRP